MCIHVTCMHVNSPNVPYFRQLSQSSRTTGQHYFRQHRRNMMAADVPAESWHNRRPAERLTQQTSSRKLTQQTPSRRLTQQTPSRRLTYWIIKTSHGRPHPRYGTNSPLAAWRSSVSREAFDFSYVSLAGCQPSCSTSGSKHKIVSTKLSLPLSPPLSLSLSLSLSPSPPTHLCLFGILYNYHGSTHADLQFSFLFPLTVSTYASHRVFERVVCVCECVWMCACVCVYVAFLWTLSVHTSAHRTTCPADCTYVQSWIERWCSRQQSNTVLEREQEFLSSTTLVVIPPSLYVVLSLRHPCPPPPLHLHPLHQLSPNGHFTSMNWVQMQSWLLSDVV